MKRIATILIGLSIFASVALAQDAQPGISPKMCVVPSLIGLSYTDAVDKWHNAGFESPVFPNRFCYPTDNCGLVVVHQSLPPGILAVFYGQIAVIMQIP